MQLLIMAAIIQHQVDKPGLFDTNLEKKNKTECNINDLTQ